MKKEQKFVPAPGQMDFSRARWCPVINCVLQYRDKILVVQRSSGMRLYPGYWNGISGFLDDQQSLEEKVRTEVHEETGIADTDIISITLGQIFDQEAPEITRTWIVHPVLVEVKTDMVVLDWEGAECRWLMPCEVIDLPLLPGFIDVLKALDRI